MKFILSWSTVYLHTSFKMNSNSVNMKNDSQDGMVDISSKSVILREATARGYIKLSQESIDAINNNTNPKGDVLENAKLAAIYAVKNTPNLVFMAHPIRITSINVKFKIEGLYVYCDVTVKAIERTGVEIEAVAGVMNALLAIFDLSKRYEKDEYGQYHDTIIGDIEVIKKIKSDIK